MKLKRMKIFRKCLLIFVASLLSCSNAFPTYSNQLNMLLGKISSFKREILRETKAEEAKFDYAIRHENEIVRTGLSGIPDHGNEIPEPVEKIATVGNGTESPIKNNDILHHMDSEEHHAEEPISGMYFIKHIADFLQIKQVNKYQIENYSKVPLIRNAQGKNDSKYFMSPNSGTFL